MAAELIPFPDHREQYDLPDKLAIPGDSVTIGRSRDNDLRLDLISVSRQHAVLECNGDGQWRIFNLSQSNPVRLNGTPAHDHEIRSGDTLQIGEVLFIFKSKSDSETGIVERDYGTALDRDPDGVLQSLIEMFEDVAEFGSDGEILELLSRQIQRMVPNDKTLILRIQEEELVTNTNDEYTSTVIERCRETGKIVLWRRGVDEPTLSSGGFGIDSALCTPIGRVGEEPYAYLYLHRRGSNELDEDDLERVHAFARLTGTLIENQRLRSQLTHQIDELRLRTEDAIQEKIVGRTMQRMLREARDLASSDAKVLIRGATGTGKEVLARMIHAASPRKKGPFVAVNCAAIPDSLLEAELFGYSAHSGIANADPKGRSGQFLQAQGGTLLLDEIGDMPQELQVRLLRVLETNQVQPLGSDEGIPLDLQVLCATHQDLEAMLEDGRFRLDLFHRIRGVELLLPPLSERPAEIRELAIHFAEHYFLRRNQRTLPVPLIDERALARLERYDWPGNIGPSPDVPQPMIPATTFED
ncbi:MAG: sigma 54-interacting transcriptional regulator [Planctomycetota bacterium]